MSLRKECYYLLLKYKCLMNWQADGILALCTIA